MANSEELLASLPRDDSTSYIGLVLNTQGARRAVSAGCDELNFVLPATDGFGMRNQGAVTDALVGQLDEVIDIAQQGNVLLSVTLAVAFGCPYEGEVSLGRLGRVIEQVATRNIAEIALADTIGCAVPEDVTERFGILREIPGVTMRAHFHDTRGTGLANVQAALDAGVRILDSSVGGLGGCPFAPGAAGNVATEDLAWMLHRSGWSTGIDVDRATSVGREVMSQLEIQPRSGIATAGVFPSV
jgi:hydroxymethylglutaryl-CoA lyase